MNDKQNKILTSALKELDALKSMIAKSGLIEVEATTCISDKCGKPTIVKDGTMLVHKDEKLRIQQRTVDLQKHAATARKLAAERALAEQRGRLYDTAIRQLKALERDLDRLEADLAAERALADRLAEAIQNYLVLDENIDATTDELNGSWEQLQSSITAWKEARSD